MAKNQANCYRNIGGVRFTNWADCYTNEDLSQAKQSAKIAGYARVRTIKHADGFWQVFVA